MLAYLKKTTIGQFFPADEQVHELKCLEAECRELLKKSSDLDIEISTALIEANKHVDDTAVATFSLDKAQIQYVDGKTPTILPSDDEQPSEKSNDFLASVVSINELLESTPTLPLDYDSMTINEKITVLNFFKTELTEHTTLLRTTYEKFFSDVHLSVEDSLTAMQSMDQSIIKK